MISVSRTGLNAAFTYDADGKRVKQVLNGVTTKFIGSHYEVEGTTIRKYYLAGATRIAMRTGTNAPVYFLQDHLGSTSITTDASGGLISQLWYKAWGELRYSSGTTPTKYTYTGQYSNTAEFGLMYYGARWYDSSLGRFAQADTLVPGAGNPQAYDRYAYGYNNPLRYIDPSGHVACIDGEQCGVRLTAAAILIRFGIKLVGNFTSHQMNAIMAGVVDVGLRMGGVTQKTATDAFQTAYGTKYKLLTFLKGTTGTEGECAGITAGGCTSSAHLINFVSFAQNAVNNVVHELGHVFNLATGRAAANQLSTDMSINTRLRREGIEGRYFGFGSTFRSFPLEWQMSINPPGNTNYIQSGSEIYADMFLGWVYNTWYTGNEMEEIANANARSGWMADNMGWWLP